MSGIYPEEKEKSKEGAVAFKHPQLMGQLGQLEHRSLGRQVVTWFF